MSTHKNEPTVNPRCSFGNTAKPSHTSLRANPNLTPILQSCYST